MQQACTQPCRPASVSAAHTGAGHPANRVVRARLCAAIWSGISDCDEAFNFWEPVHHLLYGTGLQTWEYDPRFALRSYLYLLVHAVPGLIYSRILQVAIDNPKKKIT